MEGRIQAALGEEPAAGASVQAPYNPSLSPGKFTDFSRLHASSLSSDLDSNAPSPRDERNEEEEEEEAHGYGADLRRHGVEVALVSWVLLALVVALCSNVAVGGEKKRGPARGLPRRSRGYRGVGPPSCPLSRLLPRVALPANALRVCRHVLCDRPQWLHAACSDQQPPADRGDHPVAAALAAAALSPKVRHIVYAVKA